MNPDRTIEAGGKTYTVRFTQNALFKLEQQTGKSVLDYMIGSNVSGAHYLLWAGLEGARQKHKSRSAPYSLDEVGSLMDDYAAEHKNAHRKLMTLLIEAVEAAFPAQTEEDQKKDKTDGTEKNVDEGAGTGTATSAASPS
jgi:hypothetical protein